MGADMTKMEADVRVGGSYSVHHLQPPLGLPRRITHPNLPQGKEQVTLLKISANEHQPPLVLPRRGDAGYSGSVKDLEMQVTLVLSKTGRCRLLRF